jgi:hypothetical protein
MGYRAARAAQEELNLAERRGELMSVALFRAVAAAVAAQYRLLGERMISEYGARGGNRVP